MPPQRSSSPARLLAPIALVAVVFAFFVVLASSGSDSGSGQKGADTTEQTTTTKAGAPKRKTPRQRITYTVKTGDTLGGIAGKTGVAVEKLQALNPELDPQALIAGQKIKLRE